MLIDSDRFHTPGSMLAEGAPVLVWGGGGVSVVGGIWLGSVNCVGIFAGLGDVWTKIKLSE